LTQIDSKSFVDKDLGRFTYEIGEINYEAKDITFIIHIGPSFFK